MAKKLKSQKYCGGCFTLKPKSEFSKRSASPDGLRNKCRTCCSKYAAWYRKRYPKNDDQIQKQKQYCKQYREQMGAEINAKRRAARAEAKRILSIRLAFADAYGEYQ